MGLSFLTAAVAWAQGSGLDLRIWSLNGGPNAVPMVAEDQLPNYRAVVPVVDLSDTDPASLGGFENQFLAVVSGRLHVPSSGLYGLRLTSDDGSLLFLDDQLVINHDGPHSAVGKSTFAWLEQRTYDLVVRWYEGGGDGVLKLEWQRPGGQWELIPTSALSHTAIWDGRTADGAKPYWIPASWGGRVGVGLPAGATIVPARPAAYYPQVAGVAALQDGKPVVLDQAKGEVVWVSAGIPPQRLITGLTDAIGLTADAWKLYALTATRLYEGTSPGRGPWTRRVVAQAPAGEQFLAGPALYNGQLLVISGRSPEAGRVLAINPANGRITERLAGLGNPLGVASGPAGVATIHRVGNSTRVRQIDTSRATWRQGGAIDLPITQTAGRTVQAAVLEDRVVLGDDYNGLWVVTPLGPGRVAYPWVDGFESTPRAVAVMHDGSLLVGSDGSQMVLPPFGLERLLATADNTLAVSAVSPRSNGLLVRFNEPVPADFAWDPSAFSVQQVRAGTAGATADGDYLPVLSATPGADGRSMFLEVPGLARSNAVMLRSNYQPLRADERTFWTRSWLVATRPLPTAAGTVRPAPNTLGVNRLSAAEARDGWKMLYAGGDLNQWRAFRGTEVPAGWRSEGGWLKQAAGGGGGDLITREQYENFEFSMDFVLTPNCNSGLMFRVNEDFEPSWSSGPEIQIADDGGQSNSTGIHSCGAMYELFPPNEQKNLRPAGYVNTFLIRMNRGHGEHFLNGVKIVDYQIGSDAWNKAVAASKFAEFPQFAASERGGLVLQDHGTVVWYRNIKVRDLGL